MRCGRAAGVLITATLAACSTAGTDTADRPDTADRIDTTAVSSPARGNNPFQTGRTLVIPHAGGDGLFPENTLFAYTESQALGGDVIDIDVQVAGDGVLVAFHDSTLDRTTNATGRLRDHTSTQLASFDAGYGFERDGEFPYRGRGFGVPTVEEILRAFPDTLTTIDLKNAGALPVEPVCELLLELGRTDDVYVGTESNDQPKMFRDTCPEVYTSGTSEERQARRTQQEAGDVSSSIAQLVSQPGYFGPDGDRRITDDYLSFAQASGTAVFTWVIDDRETLIELIEMGIDGIYTRRPDVMIEVLAELG